MRISRSISKYWSKEYQTKDIAGAENRHLNHDNAGNKNVTNLFDLEVK